MKEKVKKPLKVVLFFLILILLLDAIALFLSPDKSIFGDISGVAEEKENTLEYVAMGDSECYMSVSPMQIWNEYGYTGYNCGVSAQYITETYKMMDTIYEKQNPKIILLETNLFFRNTSFLETQYKIQGKVIEVVFPLYKVHDKWKTRFRGKKNHTDELKGIRYDTTIKGLYIEPDVTPTDEIVEIKVEIKKVFYEMVDYCKERGTEIVLYSAPSPVCWSYAKHNGVVQLAEETGLEYVDLNLKASELGIDWKKDTKDKGNHVNFYGSKKTTAFLGKYLKERGILTDRRNEEEYSEWNETYERYSQLTKEKKEKKEKI